MLTRSLALLALLAGTAACDNPPTATAEAAAPLLATSVQYSCTSVPSGYVVLSQDYSSTCPGFGTFNRLKIGIPGSPEDVCRISTVPTGRVIVKVWSASTTCSGTGSFNRMTIKIPGTQETICAVGAVVIPSGYTVTSSVNVSACSGANSVGSYNARVIQQI